MAFLWRTILASILVCAVADAAMYQLPPVVPGDLGQDLEGALAFRYDLSTLRGKVVSADVPFGGTIRLGVPELIFGGKSVDTLGDVNVAGLEAARQRGEGVLFFPQAGGPDWGPSLFDRLLLVETDAPPGDFNNSGLTERGDLDLVLGTWGAAPQHPATGGAWWNDRPSGIVAQAQLDQVLANWGQVTAALEVPQPRAATIATAAAPEPSAMAIWAAMLAMIGIGTRQWRKSAARCCA